MDMSRGRSSLLAISFACAIVSACTGLIFGVAKLASRSSPQPEGRNAVAPSVVGALKGAFPAPAFGELRVPEKRILEATRSVKKHKVGLSDPDRGDSFNLRGGGFVCRGKDGPVLLVPSDLTSRRILDSASESSTIER
ncbi:MAG TPA: hypothetical protein V6C86_20300 [Oculatellaceae cyanobacterium]